jgi:molybdenum cofactor cytidylyltransferase
MRSGAVAGVILAAGASSRMGRNKLLFEVGGETLLRRAVRVTADAGLDPVIVVVGHDAASAREALAGLSYRCIENPAYERGINSSVRAGIGAVLDEAVAAVVILADMPFVTAPMIATLVERFRESAAPLVISDYGGINAPPQLYGRSLFGELLGMDGEGCGKQVVKRHRHEAISVSWPAAALTDVDVPEDYERLKTMIAAR